MNWFFVVGCPRSGTTLLQQALNRHSQVVIPPETAYFTFLGQSRRKQASHLERIRHDLQISLPVFSRGISGRTEGRQLFEHVAQLYLKRLNRQGVSHFGEKSPEHLRRYQLIRELFPEAKLVVIYRDGRDVALSLSGVPWMPHDLYLGFALWLHYCRLHRRAVEVCGSDLYQLRYEDLVEHPVKELQGVCRFLGLEYQPEMAFGSGNQEGVPQWENDWKGRALQPITAARVHRWRLELTEEQVGILERWGGHTLCSLGYKLASNGKQRLPLLFFPRLYWRAFRWLATRPAFGEVDYRRRDPEAYSGSAAEVVRDG